MLESKYIIVVGCGRMGSFLANKLSRRGHNVVAIDRNEAAFAGLSVEFSGFRLAGDATELAVLRQAKIESADCLMAVAEADNVNLVTAQVAKVIFDVPIVLARVNDPTREVVFRELGLQAINPTLLAGEVFLLAVDGLSKGGQP